MKPAVALTGAGGLVSAVAAAGRPALVGVGVLLVLLVGVLCWVLADTARTARMVRLIRAVRGR